MNDHLNIHSTSRRAFLRSCAGVFGGAATLAAQSATDYKALVCIFLFGGNDGNNMVVPMDASAYATYSRGRQNIALGARDLLPVQAQGRAYGLHPRFGDLQKLYQEKRLAIAANVGMLVKPLTRDEVFAPRAPLPRNLYSHSDQVLQWQSSNPQGGGATGWLGRANDLLVPEATVLPPAVSFNGNSLLLTGLRTRPANLGGNGNYGLEGADSTRLASLQKIMGMETGLTLMNAFGEVLNAGMRNAQEIRRVFEGAPALRTVFPPSSLGNQFRQIAQMISLRQRLGVRRQVFLLGQGGYDNHSKLIESQDSLFGTLAPAMNAFYRATEEIGVADRVTLFTETEFGRTFGPSSTAGSDHAWGNHQLVMGGAVKGGEMYGRFPDLAIQGPEDAGDRGQWIPSTSLDQYAASLSAWFGVPVNELNSIVPNLANFTGARPAFL
jgi:uncharacterized protein (DUF1501 family)